MKNATPWSDSDLDTLKKLWATSPTSAIASKLERSPEAVRAKARSLGLRKSRSGGWGYTGELKAQRFHGERATGVADRAADFLRINDRTQVYRCDAAGQQDANGKHFKYGFGSLVLSESDLVARAERKGWSANAWQELAA